MLTALLAYIVDRVFGEPPFRHPVTLIGAFAVWFEKRFYKDSVFQGMLLWISTLCLSLLTAFGIEYLASLLPHAVQVAVISLTASMFIASNMLYSSVRSVLDADDKRAALAMLVSRDTAELNESDINKALIETYAENLNDAVVAPLFYLCIFGLPGVVAYKAINTLDSMVGYRTSRYERFGKFSARMDDIAGFIPARITALLIALANLNTKSLRDAVKYGGGHESPNAGYTIAAMASAIGVRLGGDTMYHGVLKSKPYFGNGAAYITDAHVRTALGLQPRFDILIVVILALGAVI